MALKKCYLLLLSFLVSPSVLTEVLCFDTRVLVLQQILFCTPLCPPCYAGALVAHENLPLRTREGHREPVRTVQEAQLGTLSCFRKATEADGLRPVALIWEWPRWSSQHPWKWFPQPCGQGVGLISNPHCWKALQETLGSDVPPKDTRLFCHFLTKEGSGSFFIASGMLLFPISDYTWMLTTEKVFGVL